MAAQDDLNAAVATLGTNIIAHDVAVQAEIKALTDALAAGDTTAVAAAAAAISTASATIASETAAMVASLPKP